MNWSRRALLSFGIATLLLLALFVPASIFAHENEVLRTQLREISSQSNQPNQPYDTQLLLDLEQIIDIINYYYKTGANEEMDLETYFEIHFPALYSRIKLYGMAIDAIPGGH